MIKFLKSNSMYDEAIADFSTAQPFLDDHIRLGSKYAFGKHYCAVLKYTDIVKIYQRVRKDILVELDRELCVVDKSGNVWSLCKLDTHIIFTPKANEASDKKLIEIFSFMLRKNNKIVLE